MIECKSCKATKPAGDFPTWKCGGLCKNCVNARRAKARHESGVQSREEYRVYMKEYREKAKIKAPEKIHGSPEWLAKNPEKGLYWRMKTNARKRGYPCTLSFEEFLCEIGGAIPEVCPVLGTPIFRGVGNWSFDSPSVDRIDSSLPYEAGNIAVISYGANVIKSFGTAEQHRAVANFIDAHKASALKGKSLRSANQLSVKHESV